jgi:hypothetical protein
LIARHLNFAEIKNQFNHFETIDDLLNYANNDYYLGLTIKICLENDLQDLAM